MRFPPAKDIEGERRFGELGLTASWSHSSDPQGFADIVGAPGDV